jgi:hypothetical protein
MKLRRIAFSLWIAAVVGIMLLGVFDSETIPVRAQQPTGSIATVTGTPEGPIIQVDQSLQTIRVFAGPSSFDYPPIGVMLANETAPVIGIAKDRPDWIQIRYPGVPNGVGWVFSPLVKLLRVPSSLLPVIEIPPTPTPFSTPTINPTLEAAFIGQPTPTRLPTFTPPAPLDLPIFSDDPSSSPTNIPTGLLILSLGLFGFFGAVISYLRGR